MIPAAMSCDQVRRARTRAQPPDARCGHEGRRCSNSYVDVAPPQWRLAALPVAGGLAGRDARVTSRNRWPAPLRDRRRPTSEPLPMQPGDREFEREHIKIGSHRSQ